MDRYDLCVIGGGPSGYAAAMRAIDFGKKVLLIEKDKIGGAGLFYGALWSKAMWEYSQKVIQIRQEIGKNTASFEGMIKMADEVLFDRKFQMTVHMKLLQEETESKLFHYEKGEASFIDEHQIRIVKKDKGEHIIYADHIVIATGSRPRLVENIPVDEKIIMTSNGIGNLGKLPESLVVVGAGVVGCEFATIFSNLGKTKVFLIDKGERILPFEDEDVALTVMENLEQNGVVIHKNSSLHKIEIRNNRVHYELKYNDGKLESFEVEHALISIGRVPNTEGLNLDKAGVELTARGNIKENDTQTTVPHIYAAGDVSASIALVNVGEREGRHAVARMFGHHVKPLVYNNISTIMFLNPEVASVGMGEQEACEKGITVKVAKIDYSCIARAIAMRKTNGFFKILVTNDEEMKILGMRAVGEHASSAIQAVAYLIHTNQGIEELAVMMHPHPSIIEGIQECVRMLLGKSIYKSSVFKDKLKCYTRNKEVCTPLERL